MQTRSGRRSITQVDCIRDGAATTRRNTEVEVREMRDPQSVELGRHAFELHLDDPTSEPAGLEPSPRHHHRCSGGERCDDPGQTDSLSFTGATETTWR